MRTTLIGAATAALLAGLAAPAGAQTVKIGFIATFSGPGGTIGTHLYDGFMLGIEHAGGKLGGLVPEVLTEDDQLKPDVGLQAAQKLLQRDKVDFISGVIFSNVMMAIYKPVIESKTFLVSSNAGPSPIAGAQCSPYFFSTSWQNDDPHAAMGKHLQDKGIKKLYLMAPNYQAGKDALTGVKSMFKGEIVDEVYTTVNQPDYSAEIASLKERVASGAVHPRQAKVDLAKAIITDFHSAGAAAEAEAEFDRIFVKKETPDEVREVVVTAGAAPEGDASATVYAADGLNRILVKCGLAESGSEATRKIKQGGVRIDGAKVSDFGWKLPGPGAYVLQVGARQFVKLVLKN